MDAITAYDLSKKYGDQIVLNNLNLAVRQGCVSSLIGAAKCGKTTALRLFAGLTTPTMGECTVMGYSPVTEQQKVHAVTGVVTDTARLYKKMTVTENLNFFANINNMEINDTIDRTSFLLHRLGIWEGRDRLISDLTTSAVQRVNIARALIHSPKVLLMDEPTFGMNQETTDAVKYIVEYIVKEEGAAVLLCTRHLDHAEVICEHFAIMDHGGLIARGDMETLRKGSGEKHKAVFRLSPDSVKPEGFFEEDGLYCVHINNEKEMPGLLAKVLSFGCEIYEAKIIKPSLQNIYDAYISGGYLKVGEDDAEYSETHEQQEYYEDAEEDYYEESADGADWENPEEV